MGDEGGAPRFGGVEIRDDGTFGVRNPGDFAEGDATDGALLERLRSAATRVTLVEGDATTVAVPIAAR